MSLTAREVGADALSPSRGRVTHLDMSNTGSPVVYSVTAFRPVISCAATTSGRKEQ